MSRAIVRLPAVLADYACARTLVCCRPPWRVYLGPHEDQVMLGRLAQTGDRPLLARVRAALERPAPGVTLLAQPDEGCALLDASHAGCAVQNAGGLAALPATCRNFPRSVVRTPRGVEVAFLLQCPTAAARVVAAPAPFTWVERDAATFPYDSRRAAARTLTWSPTRELSFEALEDLRAAWWARLAGDGPDGPVPAPVLALFDTPGDPAARPGAPLDVPAPTEAIVAAEQRFLARLDARGAAYVARHAEVLAALSAAPTPADLARAWSVAPAAFLCATGLALQFAGVHAGQPVEDAFRGAAWQTQLSVSLTARLLPLSIGTPACAVQDALTVAAHVSRWVAHAQAGGVA